MNTAIETPATPISGRRIFRGGLVVGVGLAAGQALGFLRHAVLAYLLGTGPQADAVAVSFAPIDLVWGVLSTAVIFGFGPLLATGASYAAFRGPLLRAALLATLLLALPAPLAVRIFAPGLEPASAALAARLLRITALAIPAVAWSTLLTAVLYTERRFAFAAFHHGMVNLSIVVAALALDPLVGPYGFAIGYTAGAWLQLAAAAIVARRPDPAAMAPTAARLIAQSAPPLTYSMLVALNPAVTRALASTFGPGATAAFDYCLKVVGVPLAWLVVPLSSSLLSEIAPFRVRDDRRAALRAITRAALLTALAAGLMVVLMIAAGPWMVAVLFERGRFTAASTATVSSVLAGFAPALVAWSVLDVISRSLFSLGVMRVPVLAAVLALASNVLLSLLAPIRSLGGVGLGAVLGFSAAALLVASRLRALRGGHSGTRPPKPGPSATPGSQSDPPSHPPV